MSAEEKAKNQAALESHLKNTVRAREEKEVDELLLIPHLTKKELPHSTCSKWFSYPKQTGLKCFIREGYHAIIWQCMIWLIAVVYYFFSNETVAKRGSCEIAWYLLDYLLEVDDNGAENVDLFSGGCQGQKRNSVLPAMAMASLKDAKNAETIIFHYYETHHEQCECDSMHATIEFQVRRCREVQQSTELQMLKFW